MYILAFFVCGDANPPPENSTFYRNREMECVFTKIWFSQINLGKMAKEVPFR